MHGAAESLEAVTGRDTVPGVEVDRELDRYRERIARVAATGAEEEASAARCCSSWPA